MRIAYLDCFAGMAGDMFLGALVQAGVPASVLHEAAAALNVGASLRVQTVDRSGISSIKVDVLEDGKLAEGNHDDASHYTDAASDADGLQHQQTEREFEHTRQLGIQHQHKIGHAHSHEPLHSHDHEHPHEHKHVHGRSLTQIRALIGAAKLHDDVKSFAIQAFELLGQSEARIHSVPVEEIHFHEVGAVDAIVDIVAASAGVHHLRIGAWYSSAVNVGGGMVECAHGNFPVPAPATADLLRGFPTYSAHVQQELATPTGAAILRALNPSFGQQPPMSVEAIGYGAGTRNSQGFPNVLRLSIGEAVEAGTMTMASKVLAHSHDAAHHHAQSSEQPHHQGETVAVLETALDDLSPQLLAYVAEKALGAGALDVMLTPVIMKKGRPGTLLTVLCNPSDSTVFEQLILSETSTLGVRIRQDRRACLERSHVLLETPYGPIRMKIGWMGGAERNAAPEYEDCKVAAAQHGVPLKHVQQAAIVAYTKSKQA